MTGTCGQKQETLLENHLADNVLAYFILRIAVKVDFFSAGRCMCRSSKKAVHSQQKFLQEASFSREQILTARRNFVHIMFSFAGSFYIAELRRPPFATFYGEMWPARVSKDKNSVLDLSL